MNPHAYPNNVFAALRLDALGYRVVPVYNSGASCKDWPNVAGGKDTTRERLLEHPDAPNIAIVTGAGLFAIDSDAKNGKDGRATFKNLAADYGDVPNNHPVVITKSGGWHLYGRTDADIPIVTKAGVWEGVDVRGDGGMAKVPPSHGYSWRRSLFDCAPPYYPPDHWLIQAIRKPERAPPAPIKTLRLDQCDDAEKERRRRYIEKTVNCLLYDLRNAPQGVRNETLRDAAIRCASLIAAEPDFAPAESIIRQHLHGAARACGLPDLEIGRTLPRALDYGRANPSGVPPPNEKRREAATPRAAQFSRTKNDTNRQPQARQKQGGRDGAANIA